MKVPVTLLRNGLRSVSGCGETRNLSSGGVLFASDTKINIGEPVEYIIEMDQTGGASLHCLGKVMRLETSIPGWQDPTKPFEMAVTLERYEFVRQRR